MEGFRRSRNRRRSPQRAGLAAQSQAERGPSIGEDLHVCPRCSSPLVQPTEWAPVDSRRWRVALHCPECDWTAAGVFPQKVLDRYDEVLDEGAAELVSELHELAQANMEDDVESFCAALDADMIQPDDF